MQKFTIKSREFLIFLLILFLLAASFAVIYRLILTESRKQLKFTLESYFGHTLASGQIGYLPPNIIVIKNVFFQGAAPSAEEPAVFIPSVSIKLSFWDMIIKRQLFVSDVYFYGSEVNFIKMRDFISGKSGQIASSIQSLRKQDINFFVKGMKLYLGKDNSGSGYIVADFSLKIKGDSFISSGIIKREKLPLSYNFKASLSRSGLSIEKFELTREGLFLQLWGNQEGKFFKLNGFAFMDTFFKRDASPRANLFMLDIDFRGEYAFPELKIEQLKFSLNNNPVEIKGNIMFLGPPSVDLSISSDVKKIKAKIKGRLEEKTFISDIALDIESVKKERSVSSLERIQCTFNNLVLCFAQYPYLKMRLGYGSLNFKDAESEHKLILTGLSAAFNLKDEKLKFAEFSCPFYNGRLDGRARLDISRSPLSFASLFRIKNADADKFNTLSTDLSKFHGRLNSLVYFSNSPSLLLKGGIVIRDGYLQDSVFFNWLAGYFNLPALKKINFNMLSSDFLLNAKNVSLNRMRLISEDVKLNGYFNLNRNDLVSSKISLGFSRKLLQQSKKLTPLLKLLGQEFKDIIFDFQLSGDVHRMNFQWLESDFKRRLQAAIPDFIKRGMDRNVENIIRSFH